MVQYARHFILILATLSTISIKSINSLPSNTFANPPALSLRAQLFLGSKNTPTVRILQGLAMSSSSGSSEKSVSKSEDEWKSILTPNQFAVLRLKATEPQGFSERSPGELEYQLKKELGTKYPKDGAYSCSACGTPLYSAPTKFDSGCGWPAFYESIPGAVKEVPDADGRRIEIVCAACDSHLGHVFKGEGFPTPTNERFSSLFS